MLMKIETTTFHLFFILFGRAPLACLVKLDHLEVLARRYIVK